MNCNQARSILAAHRELKHGQIDTTELDVHLEQCAACRQVLAQQNVVGERVRLLPTLEPAPDAHGKLMRALAAEHTHFLQHSSNAHASSASSVPDFLKPYISKPMQVSEKNSQTLRAFSTADTGPLPVVPMKRKKRVAPTGQFAILGLAASFLMLFLVGGLVSLLVLANHGVNGTNSVASSIKSPSLIAPISYTAETAYPHIASAVATHDHIYYSAYGSDETQWMIEQVNGTTKNAISVPLLKTSSQSQLFVLGASSTWVIWLQLDTPQNKIQKHTTTSAFTRTWSLNALPLAVSPDTQSENVVTLQHGTFDTTMVPGWVHTPIQGLSFLQQNTLLVTSLDAKGNAQLLHYQLYSNSGTTSTLIATTNNGHILTSPTTTDDGMRIFWSEEWFTDDQQPHSIIWTQQETKQVVRQNGAWRPSTTVDKYIYSTGDTSFHPQVINNTLFLLSTSDTTAATQGTPSATSTPTLQATAKPVSTAPVTPRFTDMYTSQIDESIHGTVLAFPLDDPTAQPKTLSNDSTAADLQAGTRFLLWQSSTGYQMYDASANSSVEVKDSTKGATFLAVNGDSAVWTVAADTSSTKNTTGVQTATFSMFNWPAA